MIWIQIFIQRSKVVILIMSVSVLRQEGDCNLQTIFLLVFPFSVKIMLCYYSCWVWGWCRWWGCGWWWGRLRGWWRWCWLMGSWLWLGSLWWGGGGGARGGCLPTSMGDSPPIWPPQPTQQCTCSALLWCRGIVANFDSFGADFSGCGQSLSATHSESHSEMVVSFPNKLIATSLIARNFAAMLRYTSQLSVCFVEHWPSIKEMRNVRQSDKSAAEGAWRGCIVQGGGGWSWAGICQPPPSSQGAD